MSFQPLDPNLQIDPFAVSSLTGPDAHTGIYLDADQTNSSVLITTNDTPAMYIDKFQNMGINTISPAAQLDVNSSSGSCIQLTYNGSDTNKANISVTSDGKLVLSAGGSEVNVDTTTNFNIKSHNGSTAGLMLNNAIVRATADQLNYNVVMPGVAAASKALVLNSGSNISGINSLTATSLTGTLQTAAQPNVESVTVLDVTGHNGVSGLALGGTLVSATAEELNYVDTTAGMAQASKAVVLDGSRDITNINSLTASKLSGTIQTAAQPNITSVGTLQGLDVDGSMTGLVDLSINTTETGRSLVVNSESGNCMRLFNDAASGTTRYTDMIVDSAGNLSVTSSGGSVDITSHDGSTAGLKLGSVLVTATADQINYLQGTTPGNVAAGKAMIIDSNRNIANVNSLTAFSLTGTLQTAAQPNISSVSALNISTHDGSTVGLKLAGALVTSTAEELNYVDTTKGAAQASKALIVDESKDISGIHALTAEQLTGTIQTAAQPNITSVGVLDSVSTSGSLTMGMTNIDENELAVLDAVVAGTASADKAVVLDENKNIVGINALTASQLTGTLQTAAQPNVTSVNTLNITSHDGSAGLELGGVLVSSTAEELNYVDTTKGAAQASKALVVDANKDITGIHALTALELTGTLQTASQPNITSVGTLSSIATSGNFTIKSTTLVEDELKVLDAVVPGTVAPSKAIVVDANKDISSFRNLTAVALSGEIQTAAQPKITSVGTLSSIATSGTLTMGSTVISSSEIAVIDAVTAGTVTASKAVVVDANKSAAGFNSLGASSLNLSGQVGSLLQSFTQMTSTISDVNLSGSSSYVRQVAKSPTKVCVMVFDNTNAGSKYLSSLDGISWTARDLPTTMTVHGVVWASHLNSFFMIGASSRTATTLTAYTSPDGINWTTAGQYTSASSRSQRSNLTYSAYGQRIFIAIYDTIISTSNGITWSSLTTTIFGQTDFYFEFEYLHSVLSYLIICNDTQGNGVFRYITLTPGTAPTAITASLFRDPSVGSIQSVGYSPTLDRLIYFRSNSVDNKLYYGYIDEFSTQGPLSTNRTMSQMSATLGAAYYFKKIIWDDVYNFVIAVRATSSSSSGYIRSINGTSWSVETLLPSIYEATNNAGLEILSNNTIALYGFSTNVTSVGAYSTAVQTVVPQITMGATTINEAEFGVIDAVSAGTVSANKAIVVDGSKNISGFGSLSATSLTGTLQTASQPNVTSVGTLTSIATSGNLTMGATTINEAEIGVIDAVTAGTVSASKAVVVDASKNIAGFGSVSATSLTGTLQTAAQPNVTSVGTLTSIATSGSLTMGSTTISESEIGVLDAVVPGTAASSKAMVLDSAGSITGISSLSSSAITLLPSSYTYLSSLDKGTGSMWQNNNSPSGGLMAYSPTLNRLIVAGYSSSSCSTCQIIEDPKVGYTSEVSFGNSDQIFAKGVVWNVAKSLFYFYYGTNTGSQFVKFMTSSNGYTWSGPQYTGSSTSGISPCTAFEYHAASGHIIFMVSNKFYYSADGKNFTAVNLPSSTTLNTSTNDTRSNTLLMVGNYVFANNYTLDSGSTDLGVVKWNGTTWAAETGTLPGSTSNPPCMAYHAIEDRLYIVNRSGAGTALGATNLTVKYIDSFSTLASTAWTAAIATTTISINNSISNLSLKYLSGYDVIVTGTINTNDLIDQGTVRVIRIANKQNTFSYSGGGSQDASNVFGYTYGVAPVLFGTTIAIPSIRHDVYAYGTPSGSKQVTAPILYSTPQGANCQMQFGTTTITESEIGVIDNLTAGTVSASKAVVVDANKDISAFRNLTATNLTGTIQTAAQPNITSVGSLSSIATSGTLTMGSTVISESEIAVVDAVVAGTVSASKAVVVDANKDISSFRNLTAANLTGTLQTAAQPNITSVGSLTSLVVSGNIDCGGDIKVGGTFISETEIKHLDDVIEGTATARKALVTDVDNSISGINSLSATSLTGTLQTASQPNVTSVSTLDVTAHDGTTQGLKLGGVLLTATATQINSIFGAGGTGTFNDLAVNHNLTLANADGSTQGLVLGSTLVTSTGTELNYVDTTKGVAQASKALVFDENIDITNIHSLTATNLTGTIQTAYQPLVTSLDVLDVTAHNGTTQGLKLGGILLTATATQLNSIFNGGGGDGTFNNLSINDTLTLANADGSSKGLVLGETLITASGTELNYLDGSTPGAATAGKALVVDSSLNINNINSLVASSLTGTLQTAAQPNVTSVGTLTSLSVAGDVTVGSTILSENEVKVLDAVVPGTVAASKAVVVDENKDISTFRNLTAVNLIATDVTGTLQTAAQPNVTSVGELTSLEVVGDVNVGGTLTVGGTIISENEIVALDNAVPGTATANKAMVTNSSNSISGINALSATTLTGTLQTAAQPNVTSVGELTSLAVAGNVNVGGTLIVGGTFISEAEIVALDAATPGTAEAFKAMITDGNNSIGGINELTATKLTGTIQTANQPNINQVAVLNVSAHDGLEQGLSLGGTLVTASATELNYVDTTVGAAQASKALVLDANKDISGIRNVSLVGLTGESASITNTTVSTSVSSGALVVAGGVGVGGAINVGSNATVAGNVVVSGTSTLADNVILQNEDDSTSTSTGSLVVAGGVGIAKALTVGTNANVGGDISVTGNSSVAGVATITNDTDSTSTTNGSIVTNGGVGIAKALTVGTNATVGGSLAVTGNISQSGYSHILNTTESTTVSTGALIVDGGVGVSKALNVGGNTTLSIATDSTSSSSGALVVAGGVGMSKSLNVGANATVVGNVSIGGTTIQTGAVSMNNITESSSPSTGALVVAGGVGIAKSLNVGSDVSITGTTTQTGVVTIENTTEAEASNVGSFSTAGGATIAKSLIVGNNATVQGNAAVEGGLAISEGLTVAGNATLASLVSITDETESTSVSSGSFKTLGGAGVAKSLNVGGITKALNVAVSSSPSTGSLVVAGGAGVQGDINVGGNVSVAGNMKSSGNANIDGEVVSSKFNLSSTFGAPFSTSIITTIHNTNTILGINFDAGVGYSKSDNILVVVPSLISKESVLYKSANGGSAFATIGLAGDALSAFNDGYDNFLIKINQLVVSSTDKIWVSGSFYTETSSIAVVLSGTIAGGITTLYTIGSLNSSAVDVACKDIAVASDSKVAVLVYKGAAVGETNIYYLNTDSGSSFALNVSGSFKHIAWCDGLNKFVASRDSASSVYVSTDNTATSWVNGTTPTDIGPNTVYYNSNLEIAVAVGANYIWYSPNGVSWTTAVYSPLSGNDEFTAVINSPAGGLFAIYANVNCTKQVYFSTDGVYWSVVGLTETFGYDLPLTSNVAYDSAYYAYSVSQYNSSNVVQKVGPLDFASKVFSLNVESDYVQNKTGDGYKWFTGSSPVSNGQELMNLTPLGLELYAVEQINNPTDSFSTSSGSLVTTGGVGIAKTLNVGGDTNIAGDLSISGSFSQSGEVAISSSAESTSTSTGAITTSGGVGIAKRLNVGGAAVVGGNMTISGSTSQSGDVTIVNSTDSTNSSTGALKVYGGVGIGRTLNVGENASVVGNVSIQGTTSQSGVVSVSNNTNSTSASNGALKVTGGVGIGMSLNVGEDVNVEGDAVIRGTTSQLGDVSVSSLTDSTSTANGSITTSGGVGIAKSLNVGGSAEVSGNVLITGTTSQVGVVSISNLTNSSTPSTGAFVVSGGAGVGKSLFVGENADVAGTLNVSGVSSITNNTDANSSTSGSFTTAGGAGIAKSLFVGTGIYGTLQTSAQPNISSVTTLNVTAHDGTQGLSLGGALVSSSAEELNYLDGSTPGAATASNALVLSSNKSISGINSLSATTLTGTLQTAAQPNVESVTILDVTAHDGTTVGLKLGGVLLTATSSQLNSLVAGTSSPNFVNANVSNNLTLAGANGVDTGLILGSTLVTSSGTQLNYVNTTPGSAEALKALVLDFSSNISGINTLSATSLEGTIITAAQPNISSVNVLDITGHNGSTAGLKLGGTLITSTANELNYVDTTAGSAQASKALVLDANRDITNINSLTASSLTGTLQTAAQPNVTSVGTLTSLAVAGDLTIGSTVISESDIAKIDGITNGAASASKALVLDSNKRISGINSIGTDVLAIGSPSNSDLPLEVGATSYLYAGAYAYSNSLNAHGLIDAGEGVMSSYSARFQGKLLVTGEIQITSDRRLKTNITNINLDLAKRFMMESEPIRFNWKNGDQVPELGWLAQSVYKLGFTDLVTITPHPGMEEEVDEDGFISPADAKFTLSTGKVIPLLTMTTKDLYEQNAIKDQKIQDLEERLAKLEDLISKLA